MAPEVPLQILKQSKSYINLVANFFDNFDKIFILKNIWGHPYNVECTQKLDRFSREEKYSHFQVNFTLGLLVKENYLNPNSVEACSMALLKKILAPVKKEGNDSTTTATPEMALSTGPVEKNKTSSSRDGKSVSTFEQWWNANATTMFNGSKSFYVKTKTVC